MIIPRVCRLLEKTGTQMVHVWDTSFTLKDIHELKTIGWADLYPAQKVVSILHLILQYTLILYYSSTWIEKKMNCLQI